MIPVLAKGAPALLHSFVVFSTGQAGAICFVAGKPQAFAIDDVQMSDASVDRASQVDTQRLHADGVPTLEIPAAAV